MYNTEVGYCQGMSQIAALLLMYMNEEVSLVFTVDAIYFCLKGAFSFKSF